MNEQQTNTPLNQADVLPPIDTPIAPPQSDSYQKPPLYSPLVTPNPTPAPIRIKKWAFERHDEVFAWIYLVLGFLFFRYLILKQDGLITTVIFLLLLAASAVSVKLSKKEIRKSHMLSLGILTVFTLPFSLSEDAMLHTFCAIFLLVGIAWWVRSVTAGCGFVSRFFLPDLADSALTFPLNSFDALPQSILHGFKKSKRGKQILFIVLGLILAVIPTIVIAALLSNADESMERLFNQVIDQLASEDFTIIFWETAISILTAFFLYAALYANKDTARNPVVAEDAYERIFDKKRSIPNLILYTSVTPILILYVIYVISQLNYFISAFSGTLPAHMESYAEYARRGFFELCAIAVINLIILLILTGCAKQSGKNAPAALKIYGAALCGFTLFIISTAIAKMVLYMDTYGLTRKRVLTFWFMLLLTVCFLVLLVRQFKQIPTAKILTIGFLILFGGLCLLRPDALIAKYNLSHYADGSLEELDMYTLCHDLSDDAYVVMLSNTDIIEQADAGQYFETMLKERQNSYDDSILNILNLSSFTVKNSSYEYTP